MSDHQSVPPSRVVPLAVGFLLGVVAVAAFLGPAGEEGEEDGRVWALVVIAAGVIVGSMVGVGGELLYHRWASKISRRFELSGDGKYDNSPA